MTTSGVAVVAAIKFVHRQFLFLVLLLLGFQRLIGSNDITVGGLSATLSERNCIQEEREALMEFKAGLTNTTNQLASWIGDDCCSWMGVGCDNTTGHVIKLDLQNQPIYKNLSSSDDELDDYGINPYTFVDWNATLMAGLGGQISPSLLKLKHLTYLDLSLNNFQGTRIPEFMGSLENLSYLNLSLASFHGAIPPHLGNLSRLEYLDLHQPFDYYYYYYYYYDLLTVNSIQWLSGLSSLRYLNMNWVSFTSKSSTDWIQAVTMLPSLSELHLGGCELPNIPLSLHPYANFTSLSVLGLSENHFNSSVPPWLFNITSLTVLDLSFNYFKGPIPDNFANTSSLQDLDMSGNDITGRIPTTLGNLCNLKRLYLTYCRGISGEITEYVNSLLMSDSKSRLETLALDDTRISGRIPSSIGNLLSLSGLYLDSTLLSGPIPASIGNLSSLRALYLSGDQINGQIPASIGNLSSLRTLYLSENQITGPIPASIGNLSSLEALYVSGNQMNGTIPKSIGELSKLKYLTIFGSSLSGIISKHHFKNVKSLKRLEIEFEEAASNKHLVFEVNREWIPSFSLEKISLSNLQMGPHFPSWLATQKDLIYISLKNVGISERIPDSFWKMHFQHNIQYLDLSHNQISGRVPNSLEFFSAEIVDLSFNQIEGSFPLWHNVSYLSFNNNLLTGQIPQNIGKVLGSRTTFIDFSGNSLNGTIPHSICALTNLQSLILSNISLWGELPDCWKDMKDLKILDFANNRLSGKIPESIGSLSSLEFLVLGNNSFHGKLPSSLQKCTRLFSLDLGTNGLSGNIPRWVGESLSSLRIINLRSNILTGKIPAQLCYLAKLHLLDLSNNVLTGFIPQCLGNLNAIVKNDEFELVPPFSTAADARNESVIHYSEDMTIVVKGREYEYSRTLGLVNSIDLSKNQLSGEIPDGITRLAGLGTLNLSQNQLTGKIPKKIGDLRKLETLDLSKNQLFGEIPQSISSLTFLSHLNLSHNHLSGRIPSSTQLQTIGDASMYTGNSGLCGFPLANNCSDGNTSPPPPTYATVDGKNEEGMDMLWFYIGMVLGFIVGFWGVWITLFFKKSWRIAYFRFWSLHCSRR